MVRHLEATFSHPGSGFPLLSNTPEPALGKVKKRMAARRPHVGRTSIRDVIIMLK